MIDCTALFDALPTSSLLIKADVPLYTIVAASPQHLKDGGVRKEDIIGKSLFEAYPANPGDTGETNMRESFEYVLQNKKPHQLPVQRYNVINDKGLFVERYWRAENKPVFSADGEVTFILQTMEELTAEIKIEESEEKYHSLFNSIHDAFCIIEMIFDEKGKPVDWIYVETNPAFVQHATVEMKGKRISEIVPEMEEFWLDKYGGVAQTGEPVELEHIVKGLGDQWFQTSAFRQGPAGSNRVAVLFRNITEQKAAEEKLKESESRFRTMADASPVLIWTLDPTGSSSYYNKTLLHFIGVSEDEDISDWKKIVHPDDVQKTVETINTAIADRQAYLLELRLLRVDGQWRWVLAQGNPMMGADGQFLGFIGSSVDITDRKLAEEKIKESEAKYKSLIGAAPIGIGLLIGRDLILESANQKYKDLIGKGNDIEGKKFTAIMPELIGQPYLKILDDIFITGNSYQSFGDPVSVDRNGIIRHEFYDIDYAPLFDEEGKVYAVLNLATDVTIQTQLNVKLKESEIQFRNVLLQSPNIFVILEGFPEMIISFANEPLFKSWGRTAEIIGMPLLEALPEIKDQAFPKLLQGVFETGKTYKSGEEKAVLIKNGVAVDTYYLYVYQPSFNEQQKVTSVTIMATDITEQVTARREIEESEKRFSNLLMESPFAFAILKGKNMVIALANGAIKTIWGKGNDIEGKPLLSIMPEIREQGFGALLEKVHTTGQPFYGHEELVKLQRNGAWEDVYFNFIYQPYKEADGTISGVTIIANEVTTQAIANKKIASSEQNVSRLLMQAPAVICVLQGPQHVFELANEMYMQLTGKSDMLGKTVREALPELEGQGFFELLDNVYATGVPFFGNELPAKLNMGDGKQKEVYLNFVYQPARNSEGEINKIFVHAVDVTEQVLARKSIEEKEKQLQNIFLNAPAAIAIFKGSQHKFILANKAYEKLSHRKAEDLLGKGMQELFPELKGTGTVELYDKVVETGESFSAPEYALMLDLRNEGVLRQYYFNFSLEALKNPSGEIDAVMAVTYDITEQILSRKKLAESEERQAYLLKLSDGLRELTDPVEIQITACRILGEHIKANRVLYAEVVNEEVLEVNNNYVNGVSPIIARLNADQFGKGIIATFKRGEKVIISNINTDPTYTEDEKQNFLSLNVVANAGIGLVKGGRLVATFGMHQNEPREWTETEIFLMEETVERTWAAVERARVEQALQQSEEKYRTIFETIDEGFTIQELITDEGGNVRDIIYREVNEAYAKHTGIKDAAGKKASELFPHLEQHWLDQMTHVYKTGEPVRTEGYQADMNRWFTLQYSRIGGAGSRLISAVFNDITERKTEEQRKEYLLKLSDALKELTDPLKIQQTACRILGEHMQVSRVVYGDVEDEQKVTISNNYVDGVEEIIATLNAEEFGLDLIATFKQNGKLIISNVDTDQRFTMAEKQNFASISIVANASLGLMKRGRLVATFGAHQNAPREWTATEISLLEETAERTWAAVEKAKVEEALRQSEDEYRHKLEEEVSQRTAELRENKDLLQTVFDASPNSISVYEILYNDRGDVYDFEILIFNSFTLKTIGGREIVGQKYSEAFPGVVESGVLTEFINAATTGEPVDFEKWYHGEGMHHCFRFIANKTGNLLLVTTEDITARKIAEEGLKTNLTLLQQSEDLAKMGSWEYEIASGTFTWSNGMYELFGLPKGMSVRPEVYVSHAVDEELHVAERILQSFKEPQAFEETLCIKRADSIREIKIKASIITDEGGGSIKLVGVDLDVTEAKQSEKTLKEQAHFIKSTNDALPDILFVMNLHSKATIYINHSFEERLGYPEVADSSPEKNIIALIYEEDVPVMISHLEDLKNSADGEVFEIEYRLKAADGNFRWFSDRNTVFKRDRNGIPTEKIGIAQDITVRKKAEQKLQESNTSLRYANENLQQFASIASHDLQEPLRKLKLFASVLQRFNKELPHEAQELIQKIDRTSSRMRQLITEVLQYSKIAYGTKAYVFTNLDRILQNVLSDLDLMLADTEAIIQYNEPLPEIEAVPLQMNQLFYNLLTNALKFRKEGVAPKVQVSYRMLPTVEIKSYIDLDAAKPHIEIQFSDNGVGFDQQYAGQIFGLFERLYTTEEYEGTGVGLALCKKIIENHYGIIYAKSGVGEGATFYIILPVKQDSSRNLLKVKNEKK